MFMMTHLLASALETSLMELRSKAVTLGVMVNVVA